MKTSNRERERKKNVIDDKMPFLFNLISSYHKLNRSTRLNKFHFVRQDYQSIRDRNFRNHLVLCLLSNEDSPLTGLVNFVMPLRTSNVHYKDLKDIVILCDTNYLKKEWTSICTFPKVYVFQVRIINYAYLIR